MATDCTPRCFNRNAASRQASSSTGRATDPSSCTRSGTSMISRGGIGRAGLTQE